MKRCFSTFFLFLSLYLSANVAQLSSIDVRPTMDKLFEFHIDHSELSSEVVRRSFKIYLTDFDPAHTYLLLEEVQNYLHPTDHMVHMVMKDYQKDRFTAYFVLDKTVKESILRARDWRAGWEADPVKLVFEANNLYKKKVIKGSVPSSKRELKQRHYNRLLHLIAFQIEEQKLENFEGLEHKLVDLCERQIAASENCYLGLNDEGEPLAEGEIEHQVILRTIKSLAHSLDAHTSFFSPEEAYSMRVQLEKGMCGIGVVLREGIEGVVIHDMLCGGPAEGCGKLQPGDRITSVDGKSVEGSSFRYVLDVMRGPEGSNTTLGIARKDKLNRLEYLQVPLKRAKIAIDDKRVDVSAEPYGDGIIGRITLHSFYEGSDGVSSEKDIRAAISGLEKMGQLHGVILDMRDNTGGFLSQAIKVSGLFIKSGVVVISKYSDGAIKYYRVIDGERLYDGPLVVLVSKGSASATEIVAQTLQDYGVAVVVGDKTTYGKGTIQHQTVTDTGSNAFFKVTVGRYYTPSGKSTQGSGVISDIVVPTNLHFTEIGENFLEFPLPADSVEAAFNDPLTDIDPFARRWFSKYYTPTLQERETRWTTHLSALKRNSEKRISQNKNYQHFLKDIKEKLDPIATTTEMNDLQIEESINIIKDMIYFDATSQY